VTSSEAQIEILTPEVGPTHSAAQLARRPTTLHGARVGFLWNNREGGDKLLARLERRLQEKYGIVAGMHHTKHYLGEPAPESMLTDLAAKSDVVVTALGD
jgi:hypothetical protein